MSDLKGISILIPVYNYDVRPLVKSLYEQGVQLNYPFEIICFDDFSISKFKEINKEVNLLSNIIYKELPANVGRSQIRNILAQEAQYDYLLFLDCDSEINKATFLSDYKKYSNPILIGGREYTIDYPSENKYFLHWKTGKNKEEKSADKRAANPYESFMFNNVFIKRDIYLSILLDESISTYGHEDTKFGYVLKEKNILITHINNPVIHAGLDDNESFLKKTKEGIKNFYKISQEGYGKETKLYKGFSLLKKLGLIKIFLLFYSIFKNKIEFNLRSINPSMIYFDLYKLKYFVEEDLSNKKY